MRYRLATEQADYIVDGTEKWFVRHPNGLDGTLRRHGDGERVAFEDAQIPVVGTQGWFTHWIETQYGAQLKWRWTEVVTEIEQLPANNTPAQESA